MQENHKINYEVKNFGSLESVQRTKTVWYGFTSIIRIQNLSTPGEVHFLNFFRRGRGMTNSNLASEMQSHILPTPPPPNKAKFGFLSGYPMPAIL